MKQHMSYLNLVAKGSLYKVLLLLAAALALQTWLFFRAVGIVEQRYGGISHHGPEAVIETSGIVWVLGGAFLLITVILCLNGCQFGSKSDYTLRRLALSSESRFFWQAGYNALCYLLLWAAEAALLWGLCARYVSSGHMAVTSHQTVYLTFYRSALLHSLLPLASVTRWLRNILLIPTLGLAAARYPQLQRQGKFAAGIPVLTVVTLALFVTDAGEPILDLWLALPAVIIAALILTRYFTGRREELP